MTTAVTAVAALVLGTPAAAVASPPATTTNTAPAAAPRTAVGAATTTKTVTLLTGDRITVTASGSAAVQPGPGRTHLRFLTSRERGHLTVLPQDALPLVRSGRVDRRLFDVTGLIAAGYDDARRDHLPLLVTGAAGERQRAAAVPTGLTVTAQLPAIDGVAARADKGRASAIWATLTGTSAGARVGTAGGADRIWLDGRRRVTLDHSVPQIGAPAAHQAGFTGQGVRVAVLDTGVDADHPDLTGRVAESRNFSAVPEAADTVGHGTHVASIIAGSGAASGGKYRGVAPDATLLSGKVCEDQGCSDSAILAGMQWAAVDQHADVVNMSLTGPDTPDVDPLEAAIETLTAQTGALFVISAGNDGSDGSVGSPGTADSALSVGAVDRDDALADFSSRGPRVGDGGLKPDITAPGVEIVAARGDGTELGAPVGEEYVTLSGTSMAAPHVTGAVALLAQQHSGWAGAQLKATLMASAKPHPEQTAFQQGAGRVDVARAITQRVVSDPVSVSFGQPAWPHDDDTPVARKVGWHNDSPDLITLDLTLEVTGPDGQPAPAGMFTLAAGQVTVPAGGDAGTTVTADTRLGDADGHWTGRIVARSGTAVAVTPLAVNREVESYTLTVEHLNRAGERTSDHWTTLLGLDTFGFWDLISPDGVATVRLPKGHYGLNGLVFEPAPEGEQGGMSMLAQPEVTIDRDTRIVVDARRAKPIRMTVPDRSAAPQLIDVSGNFTADDGSGYGIGLWADTFTGLTSGQLGKPVSADRFVATISSQWIKPDTANSPYLYALAEAIPRRMPTGFVRDYTRRDLATVVHRFRGGYPGLEAERTVYPALEYNVGGSALVLPTVVPGQRVEHYNTKNVKWESEIYFGTRDEEGWLNPRAALFSTPTAYRAGRTVSEVWNQAPYAPSFPTPHWPHQSVTRVGDAISVDVPMFSDAAGHPGGSLSDSERTELWRAGKLVGESEYAGYGEFTVPPGRADYRLVVSSKRSFTDLSTEVESSWTFRSGHVAGDTPARLPLSAVGFAPPLRVDNSAPAGEDFVVPVRVQRQPGAQAARVEKLAVDVSYDGGKTWGKAKLVRTSADGWSALLRHPAGTGHVSLRATARDSAGNTVTQRIIQAYRLR
ncbi:S8 family serine peptidase [Micromonospora parathelypteridis]|uniref:Subtilisin family serine protease n=1 Tax=Micromonospora parathelypteridis TaxID=1839617 RepID=A0A840VKG8_9ACTN|nr:S8 family serine peptidase [Micromonospora parathelypteridis]MBB5477412.1 subtilisin family serine protease [Micromonospora parathelypteridis]